MIEQMRKQFI